MKYIDIHTHHIPNNTSIIAVKNILLGVDAPDITGFFSAGMHPWYIDEAESTMVSFEELINKDNCLAIGECGLDFQKKYLALYPKEKQKSIFIHQIEIAYKLNKPLIIHCVKCFDALLHIRKQYGNEVPWIIHGFNKNWHTAKTLLDAGFFLSFGTQIIQNQKLADVLKQVPNNRFFLETDDNSQYSIIEVYKKAAQIRSCSVSSVKSEIFHIFEQIF